MQKHAETLARDIMAYVAIHHGKLALHAMEEKASLLTDCIITALSLPEARTFLRHDPESLVGFEYRTTFVQAYAEAFHSTL